MKLFSFEAHQNLLRNSTTQQRLNHCLILHVHREKTDNFNLTEVGQEFIERNDRRKGFFGKVL